MTLYAPNRFVLDWVRDKYLDNINNFLIDVMGNEAPTLRFDIGSKPTQPNLQHLDQNKEIVCFRKTYIFSVMTYLDLTDSFLYT